LFSLLRAFINLNFSTWCASDKPASANFDRFSFYLSLLSITFSRTVLGVSFLVFYFNFFTTIIFE